MYEFWSLVLKRPSKNAFLQLPFKEASLACKRIRGILEESQDVPVDSHCQPTDMKVGCFGPTRSADPLAECTCRGTRGESSYETTQPTYTIVRNNIVLSH